MMSRFLRSVLVVALVAAVGVVPAGSGAVAAGSVPGVPSGLVAAPGDGSVALSWDDPSDPSITGYEFRVRYAGVAWGEWGLVAGGGSAVSHVVDGLDNGVEYRFKVRAVNGSGASKPAPSAAPWFVAAVPKAPAPPPAPPARPTGLVAAPGDGSVTLSWDDPSDSSVTGYEFRMRYAGVAWGEWGLVAGGGSAVSHVVDGLDNGTEYRFKVRARGPGGHSKPAPAGAPWFVAAVPNEATAALTVLNPTPGVASMTLGGHSGQWYYQAQGHIPPDGGGSGAAGAAGGAGASQVPECVGPVEGGHAEITGLDLKADYVFGAYSDGGCTAEIASASSQSSVDRPGYPFEQYYGRTDGTLPVLWRKSATSGVTYDVVYSSDGGVSWARAATGVTPPQCTKDQSGGHNWANSVCYTITGPVGGSGNRMDNTASYIVGVRASKGGVSSWWRNSAPPIDPVPEPRVTAYPLACPSSTDYVLYMSWAKLPESGTGFEVRYKIGNGAWVNLPAEDSSTPDHRKVQGAAHSNSRWLEWMDQLPAQNTSYEVTAQVRRSKTFKVGQTLYSEWGEQTFNAGQSSDVKRRYTRCPNPPANVRKTAATPNSMTVAWNVVTGPHDYDIRYRISNTSNWTTAETGHASTSYTITGLDNTKTYDVAVRARVWDTAAASSWTTLSTPVVTKPFAPVLKVAPGEKGSGKLTLSATLTTNNGAPITKWQYRRKTGASTYGNWTDIANASGLTLSHVLSGLTVGTSYTYQVRAQNSASWSDPSSDATSTPVNVPGTPTNLYGYSNRNGYVAVTAQVASSGPDIIRWEYKQRLTTGGTFGTEWTAISTVSDNDWYLDQRLTGLTNGTSYTFKVRAVSAAGPGPESSEFSGTPKQGAQAPKAVLSLSPSAVAEGGTVTVTASFPTATNSVTDTTITVSAAASTAGADDYTLSQNTTLTIPAYTQSSTGTVTIATTGDSLDEDNETLTVSATATSTNGGQGVRQPDSVTLTINDNDTSSVVLSKSNLAMTEGDTNGTYTVRLGSKPTHSVTVTPTSADTAAVRVSPPSLTFTTSSWNTAQAVTVTAVHDSDGDDENVNISHSVSSTDSKYNSLTASTLTVAVTDDEYPGAPAAPTWVPGATSLDVSWSAPSYAGSSNATIAGYEVRYRQASTSTWTTVTPSPATSTTATISSLTVGNSYELQVRAKNNGNFWGPWSSTSDGAYPGAPTMPTSLTVTPGNQKLTATWGDPSQLNGATILFWQFVYKCGSSPETSSSVFVKTVELTGLTNGVSCEVRVAALAQTSGGSYVFSARATATATPTS